MSNQIIEKYADKDFAGRLVDALEMLSLEPTDTAMSDLKIANSVMASEGVKEAAMASLGKSRDAIATAWVEANGTTRRLTDDRKKLVRENIAAYEAGEPLPHEIDTI